MRRTWSDGKRLRKSQGGWQWMYSTAQWRRRRLHQLRKDPLCAACLQDNTIRAATVVHHLEDHKGDWHTFCTSPVESLCDPCHNRIVSGTRVLGYQRGCDINGKPYKTNPIYIDHNKRNATPSPMNKQRRCGGRKRCFKAGRSHSGPSFSPP
jgi:5-methylcytosine-specific restriction enzyme A